MARFARFSGFCPWGSEPRIIASRLDFGLADTLTALNKKDGLVETARLTNTWYSLSLLEICCILQGLKTLFLKLMMRSLKHFVD